MSFSYATVIGTSQLSTRIRRITLEVDDPASLAVRTGGDSAVGVYFPVETADGRRQPPDPESGADGRNYSVRNHVTSHGGERIDLDVVLHARGVATTWAATAAPGDRVGLDHARSWYAPAVDTDWQLLVCDLSGLPAAARIVEEVWDTSPDAPVIALVEVVESDDLAYLPTRPNLTTVTSVGTGNGYAPSRLAQCVRELALPGGRGYCWFAGEAAESRAVRKHLRGLGWTTEQYDITGYWRFDSETWDQKFALVSDDVVAVYTRALADGKGDKVASEEFDEALEQAGL